jgi:hypothetical protein
MILLPYASPRAGWLLLLMRTCGSKVGLTCARGPFDGQCASAGGFCSNQTIVVVGANWASAGATCYLCISIPHDDVFSMSLLLPFRTTELPQNNENVEAANKIILIVTKHGA